MGDFYETIVFVGGEFDGQEAADHRRLPELVQPIDEDGPLRLAVYVRTPDVDRSGRRIYRFQRVEVPYAP